MSTKHQTSRLRLLILAPTDTQQDTISKDVAFIPASTVPLFSSFLKALTNSKPSEDLTTFAGYTSHPPLSLETKYYSANVNLWCDELPAASTKSTKQPSDDLSQWREQMLSSEATEVRDVIGGIVILMPFNAAIATSNEHDTKASIENNLQYISAANQLRDCIEDETGRDVATVAIVQDVTPMAALERSSPQQHDQIVRTFAQRLEDTCISDHGIFGWEVVPWQIEKRTSPNQGRVSEDTAVLADAEDVMVNTSIDENEFCDKTGIGRLIEVLEQIDWLSDTITETEHPAGYDLVSTDDFLLEDSDNLSMPTMKPNINVGGGNVKDPILVQSDEFQTEIMDLHFALHDQHQQKSEDYDDDEDVHVEQLTGLMERVVAIREAASEMSDSDRKTFAKREVDKIMKEMNI